MDEKTLTMIKGMNQLEMARMIRFAEPGHPCFVGETYDVFQKRFEELGGMTPEISKEIGWGKQ